MTVNYERINQLKEIAQSEYSTQFSDQDLKDLARGLYELGAWISSSYSLSNTSKTGNNDN